MFLILSKTLLKFFSWPKFDEGYWNYHDSSSLKGSIYFAIRGKKEWQNSLRLLYTLPKFSKFLPEWLIFQRCGCGRIPCFPIPYAYAINSV